MAASLAARPCPTARPEITCRFSKLGLEHKSLWDKGREMPESDQSGKNSRVRVHPELERQHIPSANQSMTTSAPATDKQEPRRPWESALDSDFSQATFERHAALMGGMSHSMYARQRANLAQQLQRDYGNRYVQRLVDHIQRKRAENLQPKPIASESLVRREPEEEALGNAGAGVAVLAQQVEAEAAEVDAAQPDVGGGQQIEAGPAEDPGPQAEVDTDPGTSAAASEVMSDPENMDALADGLDDPEVQKTKWYTDPSGGLLRQPLPPLQRLRAHLSVGPRRGTELIDVVAKAQTDNEAHRVIASCRELIDQRGRRSKNGRAPQVRVLAQLPRMLMQLNRHLNKWNEEQLLTLSRDLRDEYVDRCRATATVLKTTIGRLK